VGRVLSSEKKDGDADLITDKGRQHRFDRKREGKIESPVV